MILAVLEKKLGERFSKQDVFLNIAGGIYMNDPASDLAIAASLVSSLKDKSIDAKTVFIGEIGLTGEVRPVTHLEQRINEAAKLGFTNFFIPKQNISSEFVNLVINKVERISVTLASIFD